MHTYHLYWAPEGKLLKIVRARDASSARNQAPKGYRKFKGEIGVKQVIRTVVARIYQITYLDTMEIVVTSVVTGAWVDTWSHGAWHDTGRLPADIAAIALEDIRVVTTDQR
jgi:hypothetical protein